MKIVLFDESDYKKSYWIIDSGGVSRFDNAGYIGAHEVITNLSSVNAIILQSLYPDMTVYGEEFLGSDLNLLYKEFTGKALELTNLNYSTQFHKVILNAYRMIIDRSGRIKKQNSEPINFPRLSLTKYSKNYSGNIDAYAVNKSFLFSSVEMESVLNDIGLYSGNFKPLSREQTPALKGFDGKLSPFYKDPNNYFVAKVKLNKPDNRLAMYFQFTSDGIAVLPKNSLLLLTKLDECEIEIESLYLYEQSTQDDFNVHQRKPVQSIAGWFSKGVVNRLVSSEAFLGKSIMSVFHMDTIRVNTILRAEKLYRAGMTINSIGPFEINCSCKEPDSDFLQLRALEVGLHVV